MRVTPIVALIALGAAAASPLAARQIPKAEVLVLGTYHMANPGRDLFNMQADDVLSAKRQQEIAELIEVLKRFRPTKVAIESSPGGPRISQYAEYLAGKLTLTRNEIDQVGFRLAREMGHKTIYPVDADGDFPFQHLVNWAKANGRSGALDSLMGEVGEMVKAQDAWLRSHTILETLRYMNADAKIAQDMGFYFRQGALGEQWDQAGADLVAEWYKRNIRIYSNIMRLIESPNERVLVLYGNGHLGWLRQMFAGNPSVRLRTLAELATP